MSHSKLTATVFKDQGRRSAKNAQYMAGFRARQQVIDRFFFLHITLAANVNGLQWTQPFLGPNGRFRVPSNGFKRQQTMNKRLI